MDQRQAAASDGAGIQVMRSSNAPESPARTTANAPGGNEHSTAVPVGRLVPPPAPYLNKSSYLARSSFLYLLCVGTLVLAVLYFAFYDIGSISYAHYDDIKSNLRPPWTVYRWLGSKGVDVTDLQWYYFVVALPPAAPYLIGLLFISRRLRRYIASRPAVAWVRNVGSALQPSTERADAESSPASRVDASVPAAADLALRQSSEPLSALLGAKEEGITKGPAHGSSTTLLRKDTTPLHVFHIFSGAFIALCLSGPGFLFGVVLMTFNFFFVAPLYRKLSFRLCMAIMWTLHIAILFLNFHADGYRFAWFGLSFLDGLWTPLIRWNIQYNMTILRMISFNNDLWESAQCGEERRQKSLQKHARTCIACAEIREHNRHAVASLPQEAVSCYKCRTECSRHVEEFTYSAYLGYMFYLPLFMAGPLSSFNAYVSYMHFPQRSVVGGATWRYGLRWLGHALMLSTLMHYVHIMAMLMAPAKDAAAANALADAAAAATTTPTTTTSQVVMALMEAVTNTPSATVAGQQRNPVMDAMTFPQKAVLFFLTLTFLWAKFDVIWRFFRFFALLDGFDPPEDMPRCFANTVNIQSFWRDWHASFNQWIVRYMYIPMGGSRTKFLSIFPIFFFIAIWHDIEMRLLFWALFICIGFIPEIIITLFFASRTNPFVVRVKRHRLLWRSMRIFGTQLCLLELALANLVGFAIGTSGTEAGLREMFSQLTISFVLFTPYLFFCAAVIAIQDRDQKAYEAAQLKLKYDLS